MKKLIFAILCLSVVSFTHAQQADAEYIKIQKEFTLNEDGSIDFRCAKELKLLSHYAFHRLYGETFIVYNTDFQSLKINSAYTIMADGKKTVTPQNAFNEVLPRFSTNAPAYNHIREMVVTHTGLEVGSTIYLDYNIHSEKGYMPDLMGNEILSISSPIQELIIKVNIPNGKSLKYKLLNIDVEPTLSTENNYQSFTWVFKSIPADSKDYYRQSNHVDVPRLLFSIAKDLNASYKNFVGQEAFEYKTNASMVEFVESVTSANSDQLAIALAMQKVVCNDLNKLSVPLKYNGFKCRTPIETWESNKGTQLEKALLLTTLLQKAEISAKPVAVIPDTFFDAGIGDLSNFNEFVVRLDLEAYGEVYLSADHLDKQNLKYKLEGNQLLVLDPTIESVEVSSVEKGNNKIIVEGKFVVDDQEKLQAKIQLVLEANSNPYFSIFSDPAAIKSMIKGGLGAANVTTFKTVELTQDKSNTFLNFEKDGAFKLLHNYLEFDLPHTSNGVDSWHINLLTVDRSPALEIPETIHEKYTYSFELSDGLTVVSPSKSIELINEVGYLLIEFETLGDKLEVTREIKLEKKIIELESYNEFKAIMDVWNNPIFKKVIFKK